MDGESSVVPFDLAITLPGLSPKTLRRTRERPPKGAQTYLRAYRATKTKQWGHSQSKKHRDHPPQRWGHLPAPLLSLGCGFTFCSCRALAVHV